MNNQPIRSKCVKLIGRLIKPFVEEGVITVAEEGEILSNLRHLAAKGTMKPDIVPKLLTQREVAEMLSISFATFKKLEKEGEFPFKRRTVGGSVRYRNLDVVDYIMQAPSEGDQKEQ
jgi:predicted DNA-binding transcriptional regulator AlpA